jgi:hypothetical protein
MPNENDLDLEIENYTIKDLENFFKLKKNAKYTASDIELKETKLREQLLQSGHIDKKFVKKLISFLESAKSWLIAAKCSKEQNELNVPTTLPIHMQHQHQYNQLPSNFPTIQQEGINTKPNNTFVNTYNSEYYAGSMNPLTKRITHKCISIDSRFRENIFTTKSNDFIVQLPVKINKAVSMQLSSIELPLTFYGITAAYGNNYLYISASWNETATDPPTEYTKIIILPEGNYVCSNLISYINSCLCPRDNAENVVFPNSIFSYIQFVLDETNTSSGTGKVFLQTFGFQPPHIIQDITLDFTRNINGTPDTIDVSTRIGWNLGFLQPKYTGSTSYVSESLPENSKTKYIYLAVDDYNNNMNSNFVSAYPKVQLSADILARIAITGKSFEIYTNDNTTLTTEPRQYFGPVDIQKLRVRLLDEYGRTLDLNYANFSFCLNFKTVYDL